MKLAAMLNTASFADDMSGVHALNTGSLHAPKGCTSD